MHKLASPLRPDDDLLVVICNLSTDEGSSSNHLESTLKDVESTEKKASCFSPISILSLFAYWIVSRNPIPKEKNNLDLALIKFDSFRHH